MKIRELIESYTDDDWVLVDARKVIKYFKNPKNNKAPNGFTKSGDSQTIMRIRAAKEMGLL